MIKIILLVFGFIMVLSGVVLADNFRCPNGSIISTGDNISRSL